MEEETMNDEIKFTCSETGDEDNLSEEDKEALRLGRELLKKKEDGPKLFEVDKEYHKHLQADIIKFKKNSPES